MASSNDTVHCIGCGAAVPDVEYPAGRGEQYPDMTSSGCWKVYCEDVLAREYGEWGYPPVHRLTVDAYFAQHPGRETPQTTQSVIVHLTSIALVLDEGVSSEVATEAIGQLVNEHKSEFEWLHPPDDRGDVTVIDVAGANDLDDHTERVEAWAGSVWEAWKTHHATIEAWAHEAVER